jgi:hypothetical protein
MDAEMMAMEKYGAAGHRKRLSRQAVTHYCAHSLARTDRRTTMTSLRKQLIARVAILGVEERPLPGRDDGFASLCYRARAFAHFHHDNELDLHLTRSIIAREGLVHPPNSVVGSGGRI